MSPSAVEPVRYPVAERSSSEILVNQRKLPRTAGGGDGSSRRGFLGSAAGFGFAMGFADPSAAQNLEAASAQFEVSAASRRLMSLFGLTYPIFQAPAGAAASPDLVISVCNAGAIGGMAVWPLPTDEASARVARVRAATGKPFFVNYALAAHEPKSLHAVLEAGAPVVQFSWGMPDRVLVAAVRATAGCSPATMSSTQSYRVWQAPIHAIDFGPFSLKYWSQAAHYAPPQFLPISWCRCRSACQVDVTRPRRSSRAASVAHFGSNRAAQFNVPVGRQRQRDTSANNAAVHVAHHGRVRSSDAAGHHRVHVWACWVPFTALMAPAPNGLSACSVGIGFHHCRHRHDVDHRTQLYPGPLVDCDWKRDTCRRLRNRLERRS